MAMLSAAADAAPKAVLARNRRRLNRILISDMVYSPSQHGALKSGGLLLVIKRLVVEAVSPTFLDWRAMGDHDLSRVPERTRSISKA
jgi:hypothetical protein